MTFKERIKKTHLILFSPPFSLPLSFLGATRITASSSLRSPASVYPSLKTLKTVFSLKPLAAQHCYSCPKGPTTVVAVELDGRGGRDVTARQAVFLP